MNSWFSGDFRFFWNETIIDLIGLPFAWDSFLNSGLGSSSLDVLWFNAYFQFSLLFTGLGFSWDIISLVFLILPTIGLSFFSAYFLFQYFFPSFKKYALIAGIIYLTNSYILMIITGGQVGIGLAYSVAPLVLVTFLKLINKVFSQSSNVKYLLSNIQYLLIAGLVLAIQVLFDPRLTYITLLAVCLYIVLSIFDLQAKNKIVYALFCALAALVIPLVITAFLHAFWLLPLLLGEKSIVAAHFESVESFEFFSFARLENTISLLHPNWPENIFGKVSFMKAEFLILPILAYSSLLFLKNSKSEIRNPKQIQNNLTIEQSNNKIILFFALLGLLGAFLAKGANEPFATINLFLFDHLPGMKMFRDPTKFYLLIALSYSVLIPFSIHSIYEWLKLKLKTQNSKLQLNPSTLLRTRIQKFFPYMFVLFFSSYFLFIIYPLLYQPSVHLKRVPQEYAQLKDFLHEQESFFRTLWIPKWQRYGYFSSTHPAVRLEELYDQKKNNSFTKWIRSSDTLRMLQFAGVKYIIVPYDSEGGIFVEDRKYDEGKYRKLVRDLDSITWLKKREGFGKIMVYELNNPRGHFWSPSTKLSIQYNFLNPTEYMVQVKNAKKGDMLIFSEGYDRGWIANYRSKNQEVRSKEYRKKFNSFVLSQSGDYDLEVVYEAQRWVNIGLLISLGSLVLVIGSLIILRGK